MAVGRSAPLACAHPSPPSLTHHSALCVRPAGHETDSQQRQNKLTVQRQEAEKAAVKLQARLAGNSNQLLAAKLQPSAAASRSSS